jgi:predicted nucleic acid-binding protein
MLWLFADGSDSDRAYAARVLEYLAESEVRAVTPSLWPLEATNVITRAESKGWLEEAKSTPFLELLNQLDVEIDDQTAQRAWSQTLSLARCYRLSTYDASYLELALRHSIALASLDGGLREAAKALEVEIVS